MSYNNQTNQVSFNPKTKQQNISSHYSPTNKPLIQTKESTEYKTNTTSNDIPPSVKKYIQQLQNANAFTIQQIHSEKNKTKDTIFNIGKLYTVGQLNKKRIQQWMDTLGVKEPLPIPTNTPKNHINKLLNEQKPNGHPSNGHSSSKQAVRGAPLKNPINEEENGYGESKKKRKVNPLVSNVGSTISNESIINVIGKSGKDINGLTTMEIRQYINGTPELPKK